MTVTAGLLGALAVAVLLLGPATAAVLILTHPRRRPLESTPAAAGLAYTDIAFASTADGLPLAGWWLPAPASLGVAVLAHGFGSNRLMGDLGLDLAAALVARGLCVLMFDFRGAGASGRAAVTIGERETGDLLAATAQARLLAPGLPVMVLGYSMGAVAALLAAQQDAGIAGVLADSPFSALGPYLRWGLARWTRLPAWPYAGLCLALAPALAQARPARVNPLAGMGRLVGRPVLLIAGTSDDLIPPSHAQALAAATPAGTAQLLLVEGAGHVAAFETDPSRYLAALDAWLARISSRRGADAAAP